MSKTIVKVLSVFCITACQTVIEIPVPDTQPPITVNALFTPDSIMKVEIFKSISFYDTIEDFQTVTNATVTVTEGNENIIAFQRENDAYVANVYPDYGKTYELNVSVPGYEDQIKSVTIIPENQPEFQTTGFGYDYRLSADNNKSFFIDIRLNDPAGEENYYAVSVKFEYILYKPERYDTISNLIPVDTVIAYRDIWIDHAGSEPIIEYSNQLEYCLDGNYFDGVKTDIRIWTWITENYQSSRKVLSYNIILKEINLDYYNYSTKYNSYRFQDGGIWSEPVNIYSNIEGGFGIFAAHTASQIKLEHPE